MKKLEKVLHIVNVVLIILMSVHLMGGWILGWVFDALFFDGTWYVMVLCITLGLERWVQVFTADTARDRIMVLISALLLTIAGVHLWWAGIAQPIDYHDQNPVCLACIYDAVDLYVLPGLVWAMVRLAVIGYTSPKGQRLVPVMNLGIFAAWFGYTLVRWVEAVGRFGPGFFVSGGFYAGRIFVPILMLVNVVSFLARNAWETLRLNKA